MTLKHPKAPAASSESLALKRRWQKRRAAEGKPADVPVVGELLPTHLDVDPHDQVGGVEMPSDTSPACRNSRRRSTTPRALRVSTTNEGVEGV